MHKRNNNKSELFTQGLRKLSITLPKTFKKTLGKQGQQFSSLIKNWEKIVGKNIAQLCYPLKIMLIKHQNIHRLYLNVYHGNELEIEYQRNDIINKINHFFDKNIISEIKLKIVE